MTSQPHEKPELRSLTGTWDARCTVCGKLYPQYCGSTPCCGALAEVINHQPATPGSDEESATPRFEIERALDFAESGESTGGDTTHWSLKTLARAFRKSERELASLQSEREKEKEAKESLVRKLQVVDHALFDGRELNYEPNRLLAIQTRSKLAEQAVKERDDLRSQLQAAKERAEEAERKEAPDPQSAVMESKKELMARILALEAQVGELRVALRAITKHQTSMGGSFDQWYKEINEIAFAALSSQPDLTLIEEVREHLEALASYYRDYDHPAEETKVRQLLARLNANPNPAKL